MIWFIFSFRFSGFFYRHHRHRETSLTQLNEQTGMRARQEIYHFNLSTAHFIMVWMDLYLLGLHNKRKDNFLYNELVFELMGNEENEEEMRIESAKCA